MSVLGNILWFIFGGCISGILWLFSGLVWCITIIGIPYGLQCFKFAALSFFPFGKDVVYGDGTVSLLANILWIIITGVPMAIEHFVSGLVLCATIIGIPFGLQHFKMAKLPLMPFGATIASR